MRKSYDNYSGIKFALFLIVLCVVIYFLFSLGDRSLVDNKIKKSNTKAESVYSAAEKWIEDNQSSKAKFAKIAKNNELVFMASSANSRTAECDSATMDLSAYLSEYFEGDWAAVVNTQTFTLEYVLWSESKFTQEDVKKLSNLSEQRKYEKDTDKIMGCYFK